MTSVLEVLYAARDSLEPENGKPYQFASWGSCTVGHVYRAAVGDEGAARSCNSFDATFTEVLRVIAEANGASIDQIERYHDAVNPFASLVSSQTSDRALAMIGVESDEDDDYDDEEFERATREMALEMVEVAIVAEEKRNEQARLAVLANIEAENRVDAVQAVEERELALV